MIQSSHEKWSFFDLDRTIVRKDSYLPFLFSWLRAHPERILHVLGLLLNILYYLFGRKQRSYIKQAFLAAFMRGAIKDDVDSFVIKFWRKFLPKYQNKQVIDRLNWHHNCGHKIYIITASFDFYTQHLATILPVDGVIATQAEWEGNVLTGNMIGENCRGLEKVRRLESELGIDLRSVYYYAYTDSESDIPLMEKAKHALMVRPNEIRRWNKQST